MPLSERCSTIWIVDDDEDDQFLIQHVLKEHVSTASFESLSSGDQLLTELANCTTLPRLVLLDINMPRLNGLDALALIRHQPKYDPVHVVMLTTSSSPSDIERAQALGAADYLVKPNTQEELSRQLRCVIGNIAAS